MDSSHEDQCAWIIISHSFLPRIKKVSDKICRENQNTFHVKKLFSEIVPLMICGKILRSRAGHR